MFHEIKHPFPLGDPPVTMETPTEKDACLIHSQLLLGPSLGLEIRWVCLKILVYKYIYITIYIQYYIYIYITIIYLHILYIYTVCIYNIYIYYTKYSPNRTTFQGKVIIIHDFQTPADISQPASVTNLWPRPFLR
jgi:hypothetical protein